MNFADKKHQEMVDIAISKIHWGESEDEVRHWLEEEKGLPGLMADSILRTAKSRRAVSIRGRALAAMGLAGICIAVGGVLLVVEFSTGIFLVYRTILAVILTAFGLGWFCKNLLRLVSGRVVGAVD